MGSGINSSLQLAVGILEIFYKEFINLSAKPRLIAGHLYERPLYFIVAKIVINFTMFLYDLVTCVQPIRGRVTDPRETV